MRDVVSPAIKADRAVPQKRSPGTLLVVSKALAMIRKPPVIGQVGKAVVPVLTPLLRPLVAPLSQKGLRLFVVAQGVKLNELALCN